MNNYQNQDWIKMTNNYYKPRTEILLRYKYSCKTSELPVFLHSVFHFAWLFPARRSASHARIDTVKASLLSTGSVVERKDVELCESIGEGE